MPNIELVFLPHYPKEYDPYTTQVVQWIDDIPDGETGDDFTWVMPIGTTPVAQMISKGVNKFSKYDIHSQPWTEAEKSALRAQGRSYDAVSQTRAQFSLPDRGESASEWVSAPGVPTTWPFIWNRRYFETPPGATEPMSYADGIAKGNIYEIEHTVYVFENNENQHAISPHWPFVKAWANTWCPRVIARWPGKKVLMAWNYYTGLGQSLGYGDPDSINNLLHIPLSSWPSNPMLPGGTLEKFNAYAYGIYIGAPDGVSFVPYDMIINAYIARDANKYIITFPANVHEWLPNVAQEWRLATGKYYHKGKMWHSPNVSFSFALYSFIFHDALIPWGYSGKGSANFKVDRQWHSEGMWVPSGNPETQKGNINDCPAWGPPGSAEAFPSYGAEDDLGYAKYYYERTFKITKGGTEEWCEHRVDGGAWNTVVNYKGDDITAAFKQGRGYVYSVRDAGVVSFLVHNPKATDNAAHLYEWKFQGQIYQAYLSGTIAYCVNYNYL